MIEELAGVIVLMSAIGMSISYGHWYAYAFCLLLGVSTGWLIAKAKLYRRMIKHVGRLR